MRIALTGALFRLGLLLPLLGAGCASSSTSRSDSTFEAFLSEADRAQLALQRGDPAPYKSLWSHQADVTLAGGFGGSFEQGWDHVAARLDWASAQFLDGRNEIQRIASGSSGELGYLIQTEHLTFKSATQNTIIERRYRVTMLFRLEHGAWRIIHRHADSQNQKAPPK